MSIHKLLNSFYSLFGCTREQEKSAWCHCIGLIPNYIPASFQRVIVRLHCGIVSLHRGITALHRHIVRLQRGIVSLHRGVVSQQDDRCSLLFNIVSLIRVNAGLHSRVVSVEGVPHGRYAQM